MSDWRPFEPSRDEAKRIEDERDANTCNLHRDCAAADEAVRAAGGRLVRTLYGEEHRMAASHCHSDDCEECFGC